MKLRSEFLTHKNGEEAFVIPAEGANFSGLVRGNKTFGEVIDLLKTDTTEQEIVKALHRKYDVSEDMIERDVKKALSLLREVNALDEH